MTRHVLIGLWLLFSQYVFGMCIVSKEWKKHVWLKWCKKWNWTLSYPKKSQPFDEDFTKATNHCTYQLNPKFLVNVIFCAQPPNSMTPVARKAMIVARYPAAVMWLVKDSYWLMWDTEIHTLMWQSDWHEIHALKCRDLIGASNIPLHSLTKSYFFFMEKKI